MQSIVNRVIFVTSIGFFFCSTPVKGEASFHNLSQATHHVNSEMPSSQIYGTKAFNQALVRLSFHG